MEPIEPILNLTFFWVVLGVLLIFLEVFTPLFGFILVGGAALFAAGAAAYGLSLTVQIVIFITCLIVSLGLIRPRILAKINTSNHIPSRSEVLIGKRGSVTEAIDPQMGKNGRVMIEGEDWAASSKEPLSVGTEVRVDDADGIILSVTKV